VVAIFEQSRVWSAGNQAKSRFLQAPTVATSPVVLACADGAPDRTIALVERRPEISDPFGDPVVPSFPGVRGVADDRFHHGT
jgi:hypothetical protein